MSEQQLLQNEMTVKLIALEQLGTSSQKKQYMPKKIIFSRAYLAERDELSVLDYIHA